MRKEVLYAVIAGIFLGLVVAFGVYRINSTISSAATTKPGSSSLPPSPTTSPSIPEEFKIVLDKPEPGIVSVTDKILLRGITRPNTIVVVSGQKRDYLVSSDTNGGFNQEIDLTAGVNQIKTVAFDNDGKTASAEANVVYSSSFVEKPSATSTGSANSTGSSEIERTVAKDIAESLNRPKSFIGTVTDITGSSLEIKTSKSEIEQVSLAGQEINVVNSVGANNKAVKTSDIAIGDFIVAMGYMESKTVLAAQRILIIDPLTENRVNISMSSVNTVNKKSFEVKTLPDFTAKTIEPTVSTVLFSFKDGVITPTKLNAVQVGDKLITVETLDDKKATVLRSVFILPKT